MAKKPTLHPHADQQAFARLMLLIATLVKYPGVGCLETEDSLTERGHNSLEQVQTYLKKLAQELHIELTNVSLPTLRKDLETLRNYQILDRRKYCSGYYLGTGAMSREELQVAFHALVSSAKYQGNPQARRIYHTLEKRLRGLNLELKGQFFYPVRQHLNRAVDYTDPEEMIRKGKNRHNLFHQLDLVEEAINSGQAIKIYRATDPYQKRNTGIIQVFPLQLIYVDIAWYLIFEYCSNGHLAIGRINRFKNYCVIINPTGRGIELQQKSLAKAHKLLENGWGLNLGEFEEQQAELAGKLTLIPIEVRFFPPVITFILEGERRHVNQKIIPGPKDSKTGQLAYVTYKIQLPPRSLSEFNLWVFRHLNNAQVISPPELVEFHRQSVQALMQRYC